ncbi:MAG TPA: HD domain-containing protein [Candidatus Nanoarchaeia archaeon]|nr:HD domain-containing protein [Candidatus Nanoarchaeia archaeon]
MASKTVLRVPPFGDVDISNFLPIVNSPEFQRMRQSTQLAFSRYVLPGATHDRFTHSLAVMGMTTVLMKKLFEEKFFADVDRDQLRRDLEIAALVHDLGHPPKGHTTGYVFECWPKTGFNHKDLTAELIVNKLAEQIKACGGDAERTVKYLDKKKGLPEGLIVTGDYGVDKIVYPKQDHHFADPREVCFDLDLLGLFSHMRWRDGKLAVEEGGKRQFMAWQEMILEMYAHVYFRKQNLALQRLHEKALEYYMKNTGITPREISGMSESVLETKLLNSEVEQTRECYHRIMDPDNWLKTAVAIKIEGYEHSERTVGRKITVVGTTSKTVQSFVDRYQNPLRKTDLEKKLAAALDLKESDLVVTTPSDPPKMVPRDVPLVNANNEPVGTIFGTSNAHYEKLRARTEEFYTLRVMVPDSHRTRVAGEYKQIIEIIESDCSTKIKHSCSGEQRNLFENPAKPK